MFLTRLRIFGFKSFANKVEINFPKGGIISIVGPNGCGKSNIVDAIRWVMGEQRAKQLRSSKMEDVIFSGTVDRPQMNMAEVSMLIENDKGLLPDNHTQIMITRQAYRDGDSAYLINNQQCRLKDIHHLFYDTGMGAASYSLMENRMIDSVLSDKDSERRVLFEEACGISKYKKQREETRRQLERTSQNLVRVQDSLKHTRQSVSFFERQAKKAEKFKELHKSIRSLELSYEWDRFIAFQTEHGQLQSKLKESIHNAEFLEADVTQKEAGLAEKKLLLTDEESKLTKLNQKVSDANAEGVQLSNKIQRNRDRIRYLEESIRRKDESMNSAIEKIASYAKEKLALQSTISTKKTELESLSIELENMKDYQLILNEEYEICRNRAAETANQRMKILESLAEIRGKLDQLKTRQNLIQDQATSIDTRRQNLLQEIETQTSEKQRFEELLESVAKSSQQAEVELSQMVQSLEEVKIRHQKTLAKFAELEKKKVTYQTQVDFLKRFLESQEGMTPGTQYILNNKKEVISGLFVDSLVLDEGDVELVEMCVSEQLQTLVLQQHVSIKDLVEHLRIGEKGGALMYVEQASSFKRTRPNLDVESGFKGWLIDRVRTSDKLQGLIEYVLGQFGIADSLDNAISLARQTAEKWPDLDLYFVTPEGDWVNTSGLIRSAAKSSGDSGLLKRKKEYERLSTELKELTQIHADCKERLASEEKSAGDLGTGLSNLEKQIREAELSKSQLHGKLENVCHRLQAADSELSRLNSEQAGFNTQIQEITQSITPIESEFSALEAQRESLENEYQAAQIAFEDAEEKKSENDIKLRNFEQSVQSANSLIANSTQRLEHLSEVEKEQTDIQVKMDLDGQEWLQEITETNDKISVITECLHELNSRLDEVTAQRDEAKALYDGKMAELDEIRNEIRELNNQYHTHTKHAHDLEIKVEQNASKMGRIRERMFEIHEVDFNDPEVEFERIEYENMDASRQLSEMKERIKKIGSVNIDAMENYEEEKARLEQVQKQFDDLDKARLGLERAIRKLDKVARKQFLETFDVIQQNFNKVFTTLFEGGQAQLNLEGEGDPLDAKIHINASPKGKKMRGVTLLSGGERALTAISLLFALYLVRPSPYCIMDEVDGPLDDANIGRFIKLLRRFSNETQFVVVTHNKQTMAASDMLYGVTQEVKGVSQLASVRLDEASLIAA